jgi:uncharacterized BrkB/YihY/UPF0761 family membrane protein
MVVVVFAFLVLRPPPRSQPEKAALLAGELLAVAAVLAFLSPLLTSLTLGMGGHFNMGPVLAAQLGHAVSAYPIAWFASGCGLYLLSTLSAPKPTPQPTNGSESSPAPSPARRWSIAATFGLLLLILGSVAGWNFGLLSMAQLGASRAGLVLDATAVLAAVASALFLVVTIISSHLPIVRSRAVRMLLLAAALAVAGQGENTGNLVEQKKGVGGMG